MAGSLLPEPKQQFLNDIGAPLFAGQIFTYEAGTLTPKATYQDQALTIANTNPVIANARGEVVMYGSGNYRVILKDLFGSTIWDRDNVETPDVAAALLSGNLSGTGGASLIGYLPPGAVSPSTVKAQLDKIFYSSNYATLQAAHDACAAAGGGELIIVGSNTVNTGFNWDYNKVQISGKQGCISVIDFRGMPGPATPDLDVFAINFANQAVTNGRKLMQHVTILGPAASVGVSCLPLLSTVGDAITNINFIGVTIIDFETQLFFGSQCSNVFFSMCHFTNSGGATFRTTTAIKTAAGSVSNGGENWNFSQCQFNNLAKVVENNAGIAGGWDFDGCSLVYCGSVIDDRGSCEVTITSGSKIESDSYVANWFSCNGNGSAVRITDSRFWFAGNMTKEIFFSNANTVFGGIFINNCTYHADTVSVDYLADQSSLGNVTVKDWRCLDGLARPRFGKNPGVQIEAWPASSINFANSLVAESGDASTVGVSAAQPFNGNVTQVKTMAIGATMRRYKRYRVKGGQFVLGSIYIKSTGFAADGSSFGIFVTMRDENLVSIGGGQVFGISSADLNVYTKIDLNWYPISPAGAAFYEFSIFAGASNTANDRSLFLADMVMNPV